MADTLIAAHITEPPLVSVVLPVYNGAKYIRESIRSILDQSYRNLEFIIINDGSTDDSHPIIRGFADSRIRYYDQDNAGLAATLNRGIGLSHAELIARQDQDDISRPERIAKQVAFLATHPNVVMAGTRAKVISEIEGEEKVHDHALLPCLLRFDLLFDNPFVHSSVMFRKSVVLGAGGYNTDPEIYEDFDLWSKLAVSHDLANLPDVLLDYRHHSSGMSKDPSYQRSAAGYRQSKFNLAQFLGRNDAACNDLAALYHWRPDLSQNVPWNRLMNVLEEIACRLTDRYPQFAAEIAARRSQYKRVFGYRRWKIGMEQYSQSPVMELFWRIVRKLRRYQPHVINSPTTGHV